MKLTWRVVKNGRLPPVKTFDTLPEAIVYVSNETGVGAAQIEVDRKAGCPTIRDRDDAEFDIEGVKS